MVDREIIGVTFLGITGAFGIWSATNPSFFTISKFGVREGAIQDIEDIKRGMKVGMLCIIGVSLGIGLLYGKKGIIPAAATFLSGCFLYVYYSKLLRGTTWQGIWEKEILTGNIFNEFLQW